MKLVSEKRGIEKLAKIREAFRTRIVRDFEINAVSCETCRTPGACCLDAHFVNVRISKLEAAAITDVLSRLPTTMSERVYGRIETAAKDLSELETYACPLYEKGIGCLVHAHAKPMPCIQHACYEHERDLPPDEMLDEVEAQVDRLNARVYGKAAALRPLPTWLNDRD